MRKLVWGLTILLLCIGLFPVAHAQEDEAATVLYRSEDGLYGVYLMEPWVATTVDGTLFITNNPDVLTQLSTEEVYTLADDQFTIELEAFSLAELYEQLGLDVENPTFDEALNEFLDLEAFSIFEERELIDFRGDKAFLGSATTGFLDYAGLIFPVAPDILGFAVLGTNLNAFDTHQEEILSIVEGVGYSLPLVEADEDTLLPHPEGWFSFTSAPTHLQSVEELSFPRESGQFQIDVVNLGELGFEGTTFEEAQEFVFGMHDFAEEPGPFMMEFLLDGEPISLIRDVQEEIAVGFFLREVEGEFWLVTYDALPNELPLIEFTALNILLQATAPVEE